MCYECKNSASLVCYDDDVYIDLLEPKAHPMQATINKRMQQQLEKEKEKRVRTISDRKLALQRQAEELLLRLDRLSKVPDANPFEEGEVFKVEKTFGDQIYTYGVAVIDGVFYTTGTRSNTMKYQSWEEFVDWLGEDVSTIQRATGWEALLG
jgi:hypothetical protein